MRCDDEAALPHLGVPVTAWAVAGLRRVGALGSTAAEPAGAVMNRSAKRAEWDVLGVEEKQRIVSLYDGFTSVTRVSWDWYAAQVKGIIARGAPDLESKLRAIVGEKGGT